MSQIAWAAGSIASAVVLIAVLGAACSRPQVGSRVGTDQAEPPDRRRWNIVWIVADDMSPDIGAYGDTWATTPNLDRLAYEGVRFRHAFSISGVCAPSRSALHTGSYPTTIGTHHMRSWGVPPEGTKTLGERLRRAGYYTSNNRKIDYNLSPFRDTPRSAFQPAGGDVGRSVSEPPLGAWDESGPEAHWRRRPQADQPFFAVFDLFVTHESRIRFPEGQFAEVIAQVPAELRHDPATAILPAYYPDEPEVRRDWARYYDLVTAADIAVGKLLAELEDDGLSDSTIVLFFGDHGRGLPRAKRWLYDSGIRVPLIVRWPGQLEPDSVNDELVSFIDFAPTMLSLAGVEPPASMPGRLFLGPAMEAEPPFVFAARDRMDETYDRIRAVRERRFAYLRNFEPEKPYAQPIEYMDQMPTMKVWRRLAAQGRLEGAAQLFLSPKKPPEELYDTAVDPDQVHNLAGDPTYGEQLRSMREALDRWISESGDLGAVAEAVLVERTRPAAQDLVTAAPRIEVTRDADGEATSLRLSSETPGAAIVYSLEPGEDVRWRLFTAPLRLPIELLPDQPSETPSVLRVKAGRLGWYDSEEVSLELPGG